MTITLKRLLDEKEAERERARTTLAQGRIPADEHQRALAILNKHGLSWSDLIRRAVQDLIASYEEPELEPGPPSLGQRARVHGSPAPQPLPLGDAGYQPEPSDGSEEELGE